MFSNNFQKEKKQILDNIDCPILHFPVFSFKSSDGLAGRENNTTNKQSHSDIGLYEGPTWTVNVWFSMNDKFSFPT